MRFYKHLGTPLILPDAYSLANDLTLDFYNPGIIFSDN
jgi:hypothetical protein